MIDLNNTLIFIRHGQTDWNKQARLQGSQDIPINSTGERQAARNGRVLADWFKEAERNPGAFDFVSSPLQRCQHTMRLVRTAAGLEPIDAYATDPRLIEITFGDWEGSTLQELEQTSPQAVAARVADKWGFRPPNGESYHDLTQRVAPWLKSIERPTIAVSHGGVHRAVRGLLMGLEKQEIAALDVPQDRFYVFESGQGLWL